MWLKDFLPTDLDKFRVIVIDYQSRWDEFSPVQEFDDYGREILDAIDSVREPEYTKRRPIILLGHSFGGLLIKKVRWQNVKLLPECFIDQFRR